ncbi:MAG: hypothetical protein HDR55_03055 [Treponema sp.]|nr:hypothetical protein [Treponema sp.]
MDELQSEKIISDKRLFSSDEKGFTFCFVGIARKNIFASIKKLQESRLIKYIGTDKTSIGRQEGIEMAKRYRRFD